jgi:hypothetical protein
MVLRQAVKMTPTFSPNQHKYEQGRSSVAFILHWLFRIVKNQGDQTP